MRILGNKVFSAVVLQFVLQMVTILFLYFGMRRLAGVIPGVVSSVVFAFAYSNRSLLFEADAQCLVFLLFAVAVYFTAGLFELYRKDVGSARLVFRIILAALFSGVCCFLDLIRRSCFASGRRLCRLSVCLRQALPAAGAADGGLLP